MGDEALHGPRAILDGELGSVGLVGRGSGGVVLRVKEASDRGALGAGDPKVARAGMMMSAVTTQ